MGMVLIVSLKESASAENSHKIVRISPAKPVTIGAIFDLLRQQGYDKYRFTDHGTGCRYWTYNVIRLLQKDGYMTNVDEAKTALDNVWQDGELLPAGNQTTYDSHMGTFYH